jgi:heme-degrading monooxygenase HmoA
MNEKTPVILINPFTVPVGKVEEAIVLWEAGRDFLAQQPGYISTKLHESLSTDASYQLINVAEWESIETFKAATTKMRALPDLPLVEGVSSAPQLYDVIRN